MSLELANERARITEDRRAGSRANYFNNPEINGGVWGRPQLSPGRAWEWYGSIPFRIRRLGGCFWILKPKKTSLRVFEAFASGQLVTVLSPELTHDVDPDAEQK